MPDPANPNTMEFWLRAYVRHIRRSWTAYKARSSSVLPLPFPGDASSPASKSGRDKSAAEQEKALKEQFVQGLNHSVREFIVFVGKTLSRNDCWKSLNKLCVHLKALQSDFPSLVPSVVGVIIQLSDDDVASENGVDINHLTPVQLRAVTTGALYHRYLMERTVGQVRRARLDHSASAADRVSYLDDLLQTPHLIESQTKELTVARTLLAESIPDKEKVHFLMADLSRVAVMQSWKPNGPLTFMAHIADGGAGLSTATIFIEFMESTTKYLADEDVAAFKDPTLRALVQDPYVLRWIYIHLSFMSACSVFLCGLTVVL